MTDRLPPQSTDSEQAVLGSILIDRDAIIEVSAFLSPDDFYRQAHGRIYAAMLGLSGRGEPIDIVTVAEALERSGELESVGGAAYLSQLGNDTPTAVHVEQYARIVERKALLRRLIQTAGKIAAIGYEDGQDVQESIDRAEAELFAVSQRRTRAGFSQLVDLLHQAYDRLDYLHTHKGEIMGIPSGFRKLDVMTTGFQPSDFIVLAARPSIGKTSLALNIAEHASVQEGKTVGVFSLEMSKEQLVQRLLSSVATVDADRLRSGFLENMDFSRIGEAMEKLSKAPLFIDDTAGISTMELRTKARRLKAEHGLDLLIVDYLQLMMPSTPTKDGNRVAEVSEISRGIKALARELQIPIIALSQLSRESERMGGRDPRLSDLRESGAIEQDADLVMLLSRPRAKKGAGEQEEASDAGSSAAGEVIKLHLAKHRNGPTGEIELWFHKRQTRFVTYVEDRYAEAV